MHRRRLLGLSLGAATVGSLGTAMVISDASEGMPATRATDLVPRVGAWNGPVVDTDRTTVGAESYGIVDEQTSVLDLDPIGRYALVGEYPLIPGSNYDASTDWKTAPLTVGHDWHAGSLVSHRGDVIPVEGKGAGGTLSLGTSQDDPEYR